MSNSGPRTANQGGAIGPSRQWLWALLSFTGWITATAVTLPLAALVPQGSVRADLGVWILLTGGASLAVVLGSARVVFGAWLPVRAIAVAVPFIGVTLAIAEELLLHEWAEARFGYYDSDMVWWTAVLSGLVVATSIASFGTLVAPRGARLAPMICQALGTVAIALVVMSNVEGLSDGIRPESVPLAITVGLTAVFAAGAMITSWILVLRSRPRSGSPEGRARVAT